MGFEPDLLTRVLALPEADRAELASRLLLSLEESDEPGADHEALWAEEIERRRPAFDRGETTAAPWGEALKRIRLAHRHEADE